MDFEILGGITALETIASGRGIRDLRRLHRSYGKGRWRKMKGSAHRLNCTRFIASFPTTQQQPTVISVWSTKVEDYLYAAGRFVGIEPPQTVKRSLLHAAKAA